MSTVHPAAAAIVTAALILLPGAAPRPPPEEGAKLEDLPRITVRGDATLEKPADRLRIQVGVLTEHAEPTQAMADNSRRMDDVIRAIRKVGLETDEYETGRFSLQPVYSQRPPRPEATWRPQIVAYQVTNTIVIRTKKLELAGPLIQAANEAGANTIDSIGFDLADPRTHRAEAIRAATAAAFADARVLAEAAGLELKRIITIDLEPDGHVPIGFGIGGARAAMAEAVAVPPPITPGDVTVRAAVMVVWEITPRPPGR